MNMLHTKSLLPRRALLLATVAALTLLAACQQQAPAVTSVTAAPAANTALGTPGAQPALSGQTGQSTVLPGAQRAQPTALPTRVVAAVNSITVDGALALATPLRTVGFDSSGRITAVNVMPGQTVKAGEVLATIDDTALTEALALAEEKLALKRAEIAQNLASANKSDLSVAQTNLAAAYAAYNELKAGPASSTIEQALRSWNQARNSLYSTQLNRDSECHFVPGKPDKEWETKALKEPDCKFADLQTQAAELRVETAHQAYLDAQQPATSADLARAWSSVVQAQAALSSLTDGVSDEQRALYELQIEQAELTVARARRDLADARLLSPCTCVVQAVPFAVGAQASGGITLLDTQALRFQTSNLTESDVVNVQIGQSVALRLKALDSTLTGTVAAIMPLSSGTQSSTALYTVLIDVSASDATLLPGMTGQAEINLK